MTLVVSVIAGVVVGVATEPVNPLADTTLAVVTVPPDVGFIYFTQRGCVESATIICPSVPTGSRVFAVADRTIISPFVRRGFNCVIL